jgi:3-methyladenine DNA glycosylase AlkD
MTRNVFARRDAALAALQALASKQARAHMARYGIPDTHALGVPMGQIKGLARKLGTDHALALALWPTGGYEARILAAHLADPSQVDLVAMTGWVQDFDNWAICDTVCFQCFRHAPDAWAGVAAWTPDPRLYVRRAGLALIWSLAGLKGRADADYFACLPLIATVASDPRDHVHKAALMALRAVGKRNEVSRAALKALVTSLPDDPVARRLTRSVQKTLV